MDREKMQQLSTWMGFVGIMTIIFGALSAITGLFAFIIGAIPGVITVILGVKLRNAKQSLDMMMQESEADYQSGGFNHLVGNLNTYFKIQGILIIVALVMIVLGFLASIIAGFAFYSFNF